MLILLVEDEPMLAELYAENLRDAKHSVIVTGTIIEAEEIIADSSDNRFGIILLDNQLPDGVGLGLLEKLRARNAFTPPVLMISGSYEAQAPALKLNAHFLLKPFSGKEMITAIGQTIADYLSTKGTGG